MNNNYKNLGTLIRVFFGQDYDLFGETLEDVPDSYLQIENPKTAINVCQEAENLLSLNDETLTKTFAILSQGECFPELRGETVRTFLEKTKRHLANRIQFP